MMHTTQNLDASQKLLVTYPSAQKNPISVFTLNSFDAILLNVYNQLGLTFISNEVFNHPFYSRHFTKLNIDDRFFRKFNIVYHKDKFLIQDIVDWIGFIKKHSNSM